MDATGRPGSTIGRLGRRTTVLLGVVTLVAACSTAGGGPSAPPVTQAPPSAGPTMGASAPTSGGLTLELADDADLGAYVAGADGMALYVFLPDEGDTSACYDVCATNWPPLTVEAIEDVAAGDGVTGELGTIARDDGSTQVTLGGAPLYYFIGDEAAGDVNGQGLQDVWYLSSAEGTPVGADDGPPAEKTPCVGRTCY
jgi:predicted lipoprotein with Yx(FWY)xxD motif